MLRYLYVADKTPEQVKKIRLYSRCAVCGGKLWQYWDDQRNEPFIACKDSFEHGDKSHEGVSREPRDPNDMTIWRRSRKMTTETKALAKYNQVGLTITREVATEIVETLWKGATPTEKTKAIMLCATYSLNPLMNHIFLLPFTNKKTGKDEYVVAIGIEATRLMAHRKHKFTYLDLTPRRASKDELNKILGDQVDPQAIYFITKIKDLQTGAEAHGLGWWKGSVYGAEKGNSVANMASIRSERQALKRLYPAEMPTGVEVVDEHFVQAQGDGAIDGECRVVDTETGEITDQPPDELETNPPEPLPDLVTEPQRRKIFATAKEVGISTDDLKATISRRFGKEHSTELTKSEASELIEKLEQGFILNPETGEWVKS